MRKLYKILNQENYNSLLSKFAHIHNHTTFSILSSSTEIPLLVERALEWNMPALGITDYGNMMGAFYFLNAIEMSNARNEKSPPLKGVIGCEVFISDNIQQKKITTKKQPDICYKQVLLAKNKLGYHNLAKLCSEGYIKGYYAGVPRVSKELIVQYKENLIALTGDLSAEIPYLILNKGEAQAMSIFEWWHAQFGDDFYIELLRHGLDEEDYVNKVLLKFAHKYGVKFIPQNNCLYLDKKDYNTHDILICLREGKKQSIPIGKGSGYRFGYNNQEFYVKHPKQMVDLFADLPEAFNYLEELLNKISSYSLKREILLPAFKIPEKFKLIRNAGFDSKNEENIYLRYLVYKGAFSRFGKLSQALKARLEFELNTIETIGYPGYFLIVQDFVTQAAKMNISVGPGRGSVAGSLVAYCLGLTKIDPIRYNLLFERFLNPDRISLPDIDMDFDDRGRDSLIRWGVNKYGRKQVSKIITYGRMAAKSALRNTARVLNLSLRSADFLARIIPKNISLKKLFFLTTDDLENEIHAFEVENAMKLQEIYKSNSLAGRVLKQASLLEGLLRHTGVHPCGLIITPEDITDYLPVALAKDLDLLITQFDNNVVEHVGLLKIDILGLKTLSVIKDALVWIEELHGVKLDPNNFALDDKKTFEIFQKGKTVAVFQYSSLGMQYYMRQLKPDSFDDLIALNALYRPGPIQYIPNFIARKHGKEPVVYDHPDMEEFIKSTFGITIYQEQVMLLAQKIAGFSKGEADILRKAMGKKQKYVLDEMKDKFISRALRRGYSKNILEKIWKDWEAFASYAFNKSHATCYAYLAFQTAYLKAHYPNEYMAAILSNHMRSIKDISFFLKECIRMEINVFGPDINKSQKNFLVNQDGYLRFGIRAIKGVGEYAVDAIIEERNKNGPYISIFDFVKRINLRIVNKRSIEALVLSGAFDYYKNMHRGQYFCEKNGVVNLEKIIKFGAKYQKNKYKYENTLFGTNYDLVLREPRLSSCEPWSSLVKLSKEKEVIGIYISAHPVNDSRHEFLSRVGVSLVKLNNDEICFLGKEIYIDGIITSREDRIYVNNGHHYGIIVLEDYKDSREFKFFGENYRKFFLLLKKGSFIYIKLLVYRCKKGKVHINYLDLNLLS